MSQLTKISENKAVALVGLIYQCTIEESRFSVKLSKHAAAIPRNSTIDVACRPDIGYRECNMPKYGRSITNLRYADDVVLVGGSMDELQNIANRVHEASSQEGLYFNTRKTKVMKTIRVPMRNEQDNILVNGQDIENVKNFVYLGAMITENYDDSKEIKRRIAIAKNVMISLVNVWKDRAISVTTKKRLLKSLVFSIATYGSKC